jgi:hypothetical protein
MRGEFRVRNRCRGNLLAAERLEVAQALSRARNALAACRVQQNACLIAVLGYSVALQIQVSEHYGRCAVVLGDRLPQPFGCFGGVAMSVGSGEITLGLGEFLAAVVDESLCCVCETTFEILLIGWILSGWIGCSCRTGAGEAFAVG